MGARRKLPTAKQLAAETRKSREDVAQLSFRIMLVLGGEGIDVGVTAIVLALGTIIIQGSNDRDDAEAAASSIHGSLQEFIENSFDRVKADTARVSAPGHA